jgi:hypothetical protein
MNYFESDNLLFILANQGSGGHRLGRLISCLDNVYWYSSKNNGTNPWDVFFDNIIVGKDISKYHYDRTVNDKTVPVVGERILKWWDYQDQDTFYNTQWLEEFKKINVPKNNFIHWVLHDDPESLHRIFPNAKIISLIDTDIENVTNRYMETTAFFPAFVKLPNLKPNYENQHALDIKNLMSNNRVPTEKDLWFYQNPRSTEVDYFNSIKNMLDAKNRMRLSYDNPKHFKLTWENLQITLLLNFLSSTTINENYKILIKA